MNQTVTNANVPGTLNGQEVTFDSWVQTQEIIKLDSCYPEPDPEWTHTDTSGHAHAPRTRHDALNGLRVCDYPTLRAVYSEPDWCEMCLDEHKDFLRYECIECGEEVKPATRAPRPSYIEGTRHATLVYTAYGRESVELTEGPHDRKFHAVVGGHRYELYRGETTIQSIAATVRVTITFHVTKELT